mmetsp:Transcript_8676/g.9577  ORF Transcript_8676/g.9577 Transcript_8676/m.9577 type:complete len:117 (+) Transcript_8676:60-410(+)
MSEIPFDDNMLELEEVEGFLESPPPKRTPLRGESSSDRSRIISNRWACTMLVCGFVMGLVMSSDKPWLYFREGGKNIADVELKKEIQSTRPTFSPTTTFINTSILETNNTTTNPPA